MIRHRMTDNAPEVIRTPRGVCDECGLSYAIDNKGRLRPHPYTQDPRSTVHIPGFCPGSRKPPRSTT